MVTGLNRGDHLVMHRNVESLCCVPENNTVLYVNYTSIKKGKTSKQDISVLSLPFPGIHSYFHIKCFKKTTLSHLVRVYFAYLGLHMKRDLRVGTVMGG